MVFTECDDLVGACINWLSPGAERRRAVAERGYLTSRRTDMADQLAGEIARLPIARLLPDANPR